MLSRWVKNDCPAEFSHPDGHRPPVVGAGLEVNRCKALPDVQDSPQPHPEKAIKYVKLQRNLINLQQMLANKKYYDMSYFHCTVEDWNFLPNPILAFNTMVVYNDHHLPY